MSTPIQRGTKALDDMRKSIYDQSSPAIAANPTLVSEIFTIKTPREIEMILTQLQIDIDTSASACIKKYVIEYGDEYLSSPAISHASSMDGLSLTYFSPSVRAMAKGFQPDTESYSAYLKQQEDIVDKVSNSATKLNRPKLENQPLKPSNCLIRYIYSLSS